MYLQPLIRRVDTLKSTITWLCSSALVVPLPSCLARNHSEPSDRTGDVGPPRIPTFYARPTESDSALFSQAYLAGLKQRQWLEDKSPSRHIVTSDLK